MRASRLSSAAVALASALILSACGGRAADSTLLRESFDSGDTFSRTVDGRPGDACEAARRTLLSQGYAIARSDEAQVEGNKNFQPREDDHEQLVLRISCAPRGSQTLVFVSAVQDRYALKKSPTSASVGVGALGSVSLPFGSNDPHRLRSHRPSLHRPSPHRPAARIKGDRARQVDGCGTPADARAGHCVRNAGLHAGPAAAAGMAL